MATRLYIWRAILTSWKSIFTEIFTIQPYYYRQYGLYQFKNSTRDERQKMGDLILP